MGSVAGTKVDEKSQVFSVLLADTILITADEPEPLTHAQRDFKHLSYQIDDGAAPAAAPAKKPAAAPKPAGILPPSFPRVALLELTAFILWQWRCQKMTRSRSLSAVKRVQPLRRVQPPKAMRLSGYTAPSCSTALPPPLCAQIWLCLSVGRWRL